MKLFDIFAEGVLRERGRAALTSPALAPRPSCPGWVFAPENEGRTLAAAIECSGCGRVVACLHCGRNVARRKRCRCEDH